MRLQRGESETSSEGGVKTVSAKTVEDLFNDAKAKLYEMKIQVKHEETRTILALGVLHYIHSVEKHFAILYDTIPSTDIMIVYDYFLFDGEITKDKLKQITKAHGKVFTSLHRIDWGLVQNIMAPLVTSLLAIKQRQKYVGTVLRYLVVAMMEEEIFSYLRPVLQRYGKTLDITFDVIKALSENEERVREAMEEGSLYYLVASIYSKAVREANAEYNPAELTMIYLSLIHI